MKGTHILGIGALGLLALGPAAFAQQSLDTDTLADLQRQVAELRELTEESGLATLRSDLDGVWVLFAAALVFLMQAGFCMLETGAARAKNSINVAMKNVMDFSAAAVAYLVVGFTLMFGTSVGGWIGGGEFWLSRFPADSEIWTLWIFQVVFAGTAATIVSGAVSERTKFVGYVAFSAVLTAVIYPILGHWAWGGAAYGLVDGFGGGQGWLAALGFSDFAGSTVVHGVGGAAALAGIVVVGARVGRFASDGTPRLLPAHNVPLVALGMFLLWFGWFGFNAGSTLAAGAEIGRIAVNTTVAAAAGALIAMIFVWKVEGHPDVLVTLNGALGGLVAITACCDVVTPGAALAIGGVAGVITVYGAVALEKMKLDDVVGAVPVHLFCGIWGTLCVALFNEEGFSPAALGIQALGAFLITGLAFVGSWVAFKVLNALFHMRATDSEQEDGLDFSEHSTNAYADFQITGRN